MDNVIYILQNLHWFILFIGALIFFHELGHFLVAKACGIKVERFSLGFGPKLVSWRRGETDYRLSALPLGGYVKMLGEVPGVEIPPEDLPRAFSSKPVWQRSLVVVAGPAFNFVLAWFIYLAIGVGQRSFEDTRIGVVSRGEPAWQAGLRPGDRLTAIDGEPVREWEELRGWISERPGVTMTLTVERDGAERAVELTPGRHDEQNLFQEVETRGRIGISPTYVKPLVGVVDRDSPAAAAGVRTGDQLTAVNGREVGAWHEVRAAVAATPAGEPVRLALRRGEQSLAVSLTPSEAPAELDGDLFSAADAPHGYTGLVSQESLVAEVDADTPAARLGLQPGDRLVRLVIIKDQARVERPIDVWGLDLAAFHGVDARSDFLVTYQRGRQLFTGELRLLETKQKDELKNEHTTFVFGARNDPTTRGIYTYTRQVGLGEAMQRAGVEVWFAGTVVVKALAKMAQRKIPADSVGGPIMLFEIARMSAERGLRAYLSMMALISVNLGLLNLLPIPVLDGGHLVFFGLESLRRRPLSLRVREVANLVGMALLVLLMVLVLRNDLLRFVFG